MIIIGKIQYWNFHRFSENQDDDERACVYLFFHSFPLHQQLFSFLLHCIWSFLPVVAEVFKPKNVQQSNGLTSVFRLLRSWVENGWVDLVHDPQENPSIYILRKKMKEELEHIIRDFGCNLLLATVLLSYAWELQGPGALSVNHIRLLSQEETQLWKHPQSLNKEAVSSNTFTKASLPSAAWTTFRGLDTLSPRTMMERFVRLFWSSLESTWRNSHSNLVIPGG